MEAILLTDKRAEYIEELRTRYLLDDITIDPDDPRTTVGLSKEEIKYIRGEK